MGNSSNNAFVSQVRTLKVLREQKENDIISWTNYLSNVSDELEEAILEWKDRGGDDNTLLNIAQPKKHQLQLERKHEKLESHRSSLGSKSPDSLSPELVLSQNKLQKLRDTINELSLENSENLLKLEEKGLIGAVHLVRSLREDLRLKEEELQGLKAQEEQCRSQLNFLHSRIKLLLHENENDEKSNPIQLCDNDEALKEEISSQEPTTRTLIHRVDSMVPTPETAEDAFAEHGFDNASDEVEILEESKQDNRSDTKAIMIRQHQYLPIRIWDLLLRIMGLGREAVRRSLVNPTDGDKISRIMIV